MSEPLENSVAHLRDQSQHLNEITDRATAAVRRVETFLNQECRLGLAVYVPIPPHGKGLPAPDQPMLQLGYARTGDRYRIVVRALAKVVDSSRETPRDEQVAWSECPRALKIDAFQQLPALLTALQSHLADVIQRADAALVAAKRITDVLGDAPEPEAISAADEGPDGRDRERGHQGHHGHHHHHHDHPHHGHGPHGHHDHGHGPHGHHGHHEHGPRGEREDRGERGAHGEREERGPGRHKHKPHGEDPGRAGGRGWDKA